MGEKCPSACQREVSYPSGCVSPLTRCRGYIPTPEPKSPSPGGEGRFAERGLSGAVSALSPAREPPGTPPQRARRGRCPRPLPRPLPGDGGAFPARPGRIMAEPAGPPFPVPQPLPAAFFGAVAPGNPVLDSFEAELRDVLGSLRRLGGAAGAKPQQHDLHRRG